MHDTQGASRRKHERSTSSKRRNKIQFSKQSVANDSADILQVLNDNMRMTMNNESQDELVGGVVDVSSHSLVPTATHFKSGDASARMTQQINMLAKDRSARPNHLNFDSGLSLPN